MEISPIKPNMGSVIIVVVVGPLPETAARVAGGAIAAQVLAMHGIKVLAYTMALGGVRVARCDLSVINDNLYCCPDPEAAEQMERRVQEIRRAGRHPGRNCRDPGNMPQWLG